MGLLPDKTTPNREKTPPATTRSPARAGLSASRPRTPPARLMAPGMAGLPRPPHEYRNNQWHV